MGKKPEVNLDIDNISLSESLFYENAFYLSSHPGRIGKLISHYELFKLTLNLPGDIIECGVFKGASLCRFTKFRNIMQGAFLKKIIGFDIFGEFPLPEKSDKVFEEDMDFRKKFVESAGSKSINREKLLSFLANCDSSENVELIKGNISDTIPKYLDKNPNLKISLLHIDVDLYKPTFDCLNNLYDRVVKEGVIILDDYKSFPGATKAIDEYFLDKQFVKINKLPWGASPFYIVKT